MKVRVDIKADVDGAQAVDGLAQAVDRLGDRGKEGFDRAAQSGRQLDDSVDALTASFDQAFDAMRRGAAATEQVQQAFRTLNIRQAAAIEADILEVNQALLRLSASGRLTGDELDRAFAAARARLAELDRELRATPDAVQQVGTRARELSGILGTLTAAFSGVELARQFWLVNTALENVERTLRVITGSSSSAANELEYVRHVAGKLGLSVIDLSRSWADLAAATKGSRVEGQATREVFEASARAMQVAGKSTQETNELFRALFQIASKGVVQMEELRGQIGEKLPGALQRVAEGLGITVGELNKLVESGTMTADELFPALAAGLNRFNAEAIRSGANVQTLSQKWELFKNAVNDAWKALGDAGLAKAFGASLEYLGAQLIVITVYTVAAGKALGTFFAAVASGDIGLRGVSQRAKEAFAEIEREARDKLLAAAEHNGQLAARLTETERAAYRAREAADQAAKGIGQVGVAAGGASTALVQLKVRYADLQEKSERLVALSAAQAEAVEKEGAATTSLADKLGTETQRREAAAQAAERNAQATARLAAEKEADAARTQRYLANLEAQFALQGEVAEQDQKLLDATRAKAKEKAAEAAASAAAAQSAAISATATRAEAEAYEDNSARVLELRAAYQAAQKAVEALIAAKERGRATSEAVQQAQRAEAAAGRLYRDALADQVERIHAAAMEKQAALSVDQAAVRLAIEQQRTALEVARARGDERAAIAAVIEIKRLEVRLNELLAQAKRAEADSILATVAAKRAELSASGDLTAAKEAELRAQEAAARVKRVEGDIAAETAKRLRELGEASRWASSGMGELGDGARGASGEFDRLRGRVDSTTDAIGRLLAAQRGGIGGGAGGGSGGELQADLLRAAGLSQREIEDYYGNRRLSEADKAAGYVMRNVSSQQIDVEQLARQAGFQREQVRAFVAEFGEVFAEELAAMREKLRAVPVIDTGGYLDEYSGAFERARQRAADAVREAARAEGAAAATRQAPAAVEKPGSLHRVELRVDHGEERVIHMAAEEDARALIDVLAEFQRRYSGGTPAA